RCVAATTALSRETTEAFDLDGVEVVPCRAGHDGGRWILGQSVRGRLVDEKRNARGLAVAAKGASQVPTTGRRGLDARLGDPHDEDRSSFMLLDLGLHTQ